jgi:hypothetical protein
VGKIPDIVWYFQDFFPQNYNPSGSIFSKATVAQAPPRCQGQAARCAAHTVPQAVSTFFHSIPTRSSHQWQTMWQSRQARGRTERPFLTLRDSASSLPGARSSFCDPESSTGWAASTVSTALSPATELCRSLKVLRAVVGEMLTRRPCAETPVMSSSFGPDTFETGRAATSMLACPTS